MATLIGSHLTRQPTASPVLTKWWKSELMLATNFGSICRKVTNFGSQNFGYQISFCTRLFNIDEKKFTEICSQMSNWLVLLRLATTKRNVVKQSLCSYTSGPEVASFSKEVNSSLSKRPLVFNGHLAKHGLTSFVKEATCGLTFLAWVCLRLWHTMSEWHAIT